MASVGVSNCFEVLVNGISMLIESNLRNLDLTWNLLFWKSSIFKTKATDCNLVITNNVCGYLSTIGQVCSNFYRFDIKSSHGCPSNISMTTLLIRIMILLLYCYWICSFKERNSYFWMLLTINICNYGIIICNVLCENHHYKIHVIDKINHLTIINVFCILCWMREVELDEILRTNAKRKIIDDVNGYINNMVGKKPMPYKSQLAELVKTIVTIGFNVETVEYTNILFTACDVGGRDNQNIHDIMFVVNGNGCDGTDSAEEELIINRMYMPAHDELKDLPSKMSANEVTKRLDLNQFAALIWIVCVNIDTMDNLVDIHFTFAIQ